MRDESNHLARETMRDEADIAPQLTHHQALVLRRSVALRIATLGTELAQRIDADCYTVSGQQGDLREELRELLDIHEELA